MKILSLDPNMRGFTLVELMVTLVIGSVIATGIYSAYISQQRINQAQDQIVEMQQNLRAGLDMMTRELRMAGFDPGGEQREAGNVGFSDATATSVTFTMRADGDGRDNDNDGERDEEDESGGVTTISYSLQDAYGDGTMDLVRQEDSGPSIALIEHIENIEFLYILEDGTSQLNPGDLSDIRSVKISILVRASGPIIADQEYVQSYTTGSGNTWGPFNTASPFFRRRMQIITVDCRNMF